MPHVNVIKQIRVGKGWKLVSIPRNRHGGYDWRALPEGRYFIEWWERGKRKRQAAGATTADALEAARRRKHAMEGKALGIESESALEEETKRAPLHLAVKRYLEVVEGLKKPNTLRKYKAVLNRFLDYFSDRSNAKSISPDDLNDFMVHFKKKHQLDNNSVIHNIIIVAQFLKKQGRAGLTRSIDLPEAIRSLPEEYNDQDLQAFFAACTKEEETLFMTFLLTGFREQEVVHLSWNDIHFTLNTVRVTAKPDLGFSPKRWEEREVPVPKQLIELLNVHPRKDGSRLVVPSPRGTRELHLLAKCKASAERGQANPGAFSSSQIPLHLCHANAAFRVRRAHGSTLDGSQVLGNDYAVSFAGQGCA